MILCIADIHLGHKHYATMTQAGVSTGEIDSRQALEQMYIKTMAPEIEVVFILGDFFDSSKPATESIKWAIGWFKKMDALSKPIYIIPGNHDVSRHSNSLVFLKALNIKNTFLIDDDLAKIKIGDINVYFVPFMSPSSLKNKYSSTLEVFDKMIQVIDPREKNIIVAHLQESASKTGSEVTMMSRSVEVIDMDKYPLFEKTIFLSGHMHLQQTYKKNNGLEVIYPGSLTFLDITDCDLKKGYAILDADLNYSFEESVGGRKYKKYIIPAGIDPEVFMGSVQINEGDVIFIKSATSDVINETAIRSILDKHGCSLGKISYSFEEETELANAILESTNDPMALFNEWIALQPEGLNAVVLTAMATQYFTEYNKDKGDE